MVKKRRSKPRRVSVARDPKYLEFLRDYGFCAILCTIPEQCKGKIKAAHGKVNGIGSKGSDLEAVPLCQEHHREEHRIGAKTFWAKYWLDRSAIVAYWQNEYKQEIRNDESSK